MSLCSLVSLDPNNLPTIAVVGLQFGCASPSSIILSSCSSVAVSQKHPPMGHPRLDEPHLGHSSLVVVICSSVCLETLTRNLEITKPIQFFLKIVKKRGEVLSFFFATTHRTRVPLSRPFSRRLRRNPHPPLSIPPKSKNIATSPYLLYVQYRKHSFYGGLRP